MRLVFFYLKNPTQYFFNAGTPRTTLGAIAVRRESSPPSASYIIFTSMLTPDGKSMLESASITFGAGFKMSIILL